MLSKYKNLFGKPRTGLHKYRIFDIAIFDVILTVIGAKIVSNKYNKNFKEVLIILFLLGIVMHKLFGVETTINKKLNL